MVVKLPEFEKIAIEPLRSASAGIVAAERPADADLVPGVRHAEAVAAEDVDPVLLPHRADLARVVHRQLLGHDEDLLELGIDPDQLGDAVAGAEGGR